MQRRSILTGALASIAVPGFAQGLDVRQIDVAVIGAGLAGLSAAVSVRECCSASVEIFEKEPVIGGHSAVSTGYFSAATRKGRSQSQYRQAVEAMIHDMTVSGQGKGNPVLIRQLAERSDAAFEWLSDKGVVWLPEPYEALGGMAKRSYISSFVRGGYDYVVALSRRVREQSIPLHFSAPVRDIRYLAQSGRYELEIGGRTSERIVARSVVIATGGFGENVALRRKYDSRLDAQFTSTANPYGDGRNTATGDGIVMAERLGAALVDMEQILTIPFSGGRLTNYVGADIYLNEQARRFVNEAAPMQEISRALWELPQRQFWVLTDSQSAKGASRNRKLIRGAVRTAESLREVAEAMAVPYERLRDTVERYNGFARSGKDLDFGKTQFTQEISKPPFYFGIERPYVHFCNGGIRFDESARVLDVQGHTIPGLFAAGEVTGGLHGWGRLGGCSLTDCVVFGRIAGEAAGKWLGKNA